MPIRDRVDAQPRRGRAALAVALTLVLAACGDSGAAPEGLTGDEERYLDDVLRAWSMFDERNAELGAALAQTYHTNEALFAALEAAGAGTAFEPGLEMLEELDPPGRFADDHELLLEQQRTRVLIDRQIGEAVADSDLARFVLLNMRLGLVGSTTPRLDEALCVPLYTQDLGDHPAGAAYLAEVLCDREPLPGDGYGDAVRDALREATIELEARAAAMGFFDLVPQVDEESRREVIGEAFTEIVRLVSSTRDAIAALQPPDRMAGDHEHLLAYLESLELHVDALTSAAVAGDLDALDGEGFREIYCTARDEVGQAYRPIVRVHFADLFAVCPGSAPF